LKIYNQSFMECFRNIAFWCEGEKLSDDPWVSTRLRHVGIYLAMLIPIYFAVALHITVVAVLVPTTILILVCGVGLIILVGVNTWYCHSLFILIRNHRTIQRLKHIGYYWIPAFIYPIALYVASLGLNKFDGSETVLVASPWLLTVGILIVSGLIFGAYHTVISLRESCSKCSRMRNGNEPIVWVCFTTDSYKND